MKQPTLAGFREAIARAFSSPSPTPSQLVRIRQLCQAIADEGDITDDHPVMDTHRDVFSLARRLGLIDQGSYWIPLVRLTAKGEALIRGEKSPSPEAATVLAGGRR